MNGRARRDMCICSYEKLSIRRINGVACSNFDCIVEFGANDRLKLDFMKEGFILGISKCVCFLCVGYVAEVMWVCTYRWILLKNFFFAYPDVILFISTRPFILGTSSALYVTVIYQSSSCTINLLLEYSVRYFDSVLINGRRKGCDNANTLKFIDCLHQWKQKKGTDKLPIKQCPHKLPCW